jgi:hypothetical protein
MATFPCSRCGQRYAGPQQTIYPSFVSPEGTLSFKLRCCPECFKAVVQAPELDLVGTSVERYDKACYRCGTADGYVAQVFAPYYEARQDRQDLYGRLCSVCLPPTLAFLVGASEPQQRQPPPP